jgi:hypothetical protein
MKDWFPAIGQVHFGVDVNVNAEVITQRAIGIHLHILSVSIKTGSDALFPDELFHCSRFARQLQDP